MSSLELNQGDIIGKKPQKVGIVEIFRDHGLTIFFDFLFFPHQYGIVTLSQRQIG
jgi:hypothetical protein